MKGPYQTTPKAP